MTDRWSRWDSNRGGVNPLKNNDCGDSARGRAAEAGAVAADSPPLDPDLARLIEAWPYLPEPVRAGIVGIVRAVGE